MPDSQERVLTRTYSWLAVASVIPLLIVIILLAMFQLNAQRGSAARGARGAGGRAQHPAQQHRQDGAGSRPHAGRLGRGLLDRKRSGAPAADAAAGARTIADGGLRDPGRGLRRAPGCRGRGAPGGEPVAPHAAVPSGDALSALELLRLGAGGPGERGAVRRRARASVASCAGPRRPRWWSGSRTIRSCAGRPSGPAPRSTTAGPRPTTIRPARAGRSPMPRSSRPRGARSAWSAPRCCSIS